MVGLCPDVCSFFVGDPDATIVIDVICNNGVQ
jgi:hypothetical protein